jgi:hypothetical protein
MKHAINYFMFLDSNYCSVNMHRINLSIEQLRKLSCAVQKHEIRKQFYECS